MGGRWLRLLVPEVIQTSAMDCGPASLKALLEGFGIPVSYGRLREACQTDVDGTSINTLEKVAIQLGIDAEQVLIPLDHVMLPEARALPALMVIRQPSGATHFVVVWRRLGRFVQVMDPATGRHWKTTTALVNDLHMHSMAVPAMGWREWAGSEEFLAPLGARLKALGVSSEAAQQLVEEALNQPGWWPIATLDAATRMVNSIVSGRGLRSGKQATAVLQRLFKQVCKTPGDEDSAIPHIYWSVHPESADPQGEEQVRLHGPVLVRIKGKMPPEGDRGEDEPTPLSPELVAALSEPSSRPGRELLRYLRADGLGSTALLSTVILLSGLVVALEAILLRAFLDLGRELVPGDQRLAAAIALLAFLLAGLGLELPMMGALWRLGRGLELRLRTAFLEKIPRLGDRYLQSRLTSDMAYRSHTVHILRMLPSLGGRFLREVGELGWTAAGIIWIDPLCAPVVLVAAGAAVGLPLLAQPILAERDLRLRNHSGALSRFYLDGLLGLIPIRTHRAGRAVQREHESLLVEWARAGLGMQRLAVATEGISSLVGLGLAALLVISHATRAGDGAAVLLLTYWALRLPVLGDSIALQARQYPARRNTALRLFEPLGALEEQTSPTEQVAPGEEADSGGGIAIAMEKVTLCAAGHTILHAIDITIPAGSHVAIVGRSGAGKSSLVGLLLGWQRPAAGQVRVDNSPLTRARLLALRRQTVWVDPAVQLWNRSLLDNLCYGIPDQVLPPLGPALEQAELYDLLQHLPEGLQTCLGEGGTLVSGGEGQRVRLGRAMLHPEARLAILDEPFRGLDRRLRRILLQRTRNLWQAATLLCITHDLDSTRSFDRVLVIDEGRIVEDGAPETLARQEGSRYRALIEAEDEVRHGLWSSSAWKRIRLEHGRVREEGCQEEAR